VGFPTGRRRSASVRSRRSAGKAWPDCRTSRRNRSVIRRGEGLSPFPRGDKACEDAQWRTERPGWAPARRAASLYPD
jgi:hypothetical protein